MLLGELESRFILNSSLKKTMDEHRNACHEVLKNHDDVDVGQQYKTILNSATRSILKCSIQKVPIMNQISLINKQIS